MIVSVLKSNHVLLFPLVADNELTCHFFFFLRILVIVNFFLSDTSRENAGKFFYGPTIFLNFGLVTFTFEQVSLERTRISLSLLRPRYG